MECSDTEPRATSQSASGPQKSVPQNPAAPPPTSGRAQKSVARQYPLFEPATVPDYRTDSFILTEQTDTLLKTLTAWVSTDEPCLVICGPVASGKTHLAHIMNGHLHSHLYADDILMVSAKTIDANDIAALDLPAALLLDDVDAMVTRPRALLDLVSDCRSAGCRLVLIGRDNPGDWAGGLKDLFTRLEAMARITVPEPNERLIRAVIGRHLRARQLSLAPDEIDRIAERAALHIPRTFAAAELFTRALDLEALGAGKKPSQQVVSHVLNAYFS